MESNDQSFITELDDKATDDVNGASGFNFGFSKPEKIGLATGTVAGTGLLATAEGLKDKRNGCGTKEIAKNAAMAGAILGAPPGAAGGYLFGNMVKTFKKKDAQLVKPLLQ